MLTDLYSGSMSVYYSFNFSMFGYFKIKYWKNIYIYLYIF